MTLYAPDGAGRAAFGRSPDDMTDDYVQPIAQHVDHPERLLLRGADGRWYLWSGDRLESALVEIPSATAAWLLVRPALRLLPGPLVWLHPADLPLLPFDALPSRWHPADDAPAEQ
jgi:hypothetical protein